MAKRINLTGQRFGRLTVLSYIETRKNSTAWRVKCDCGNVNEVLRVNLINGGTQSCGCLRHEQLKNRNADPDLTGRLFGKWCVEKLVSGKNWPIYWSCICVCGVRKNVLETSLKSGKSKSCGCGKIVNVKAMEEDLANQRFGRLTVIRRLPKLKNSKVTARRWLCICDCGAETVVFTSPLVSKIRSCGCEQRDLKEQELTRDDLSNPAFNKLVACTYRSHAKEKKISCDLTLEDFLKLFKAKCFYCGVAPYRIATERQKRYTFTFNGIDRIDSKLGYTLSNVVTACTICNRAKNTQTVAEFKSWVARIHSYLFTEVNNNAET